MPAESPASVTVTKNTAVGPSVPAKDELGGPVSAETTAALADNSRLHASGSGSLGYACGGVVSGVGSFIVGDRMPDPASLTVGLAIPAAGWGAIGAAALPALGAPLTNERIETARIAAGIELEASFEAGSKWCVHDEHLRKFAEAILAGG